MALRLNPFFFIFIFLYNGPQNPFSFQGKKTVLDHPFRTAFAFEISIAYRYFLYIVCRRTALSMIWIAISIHVSHLI